MEAVQHVRPDEMLFAGKRGAVAGEAQVMRHGRRGGGEFRRIVEGAHARGQHAGQHGKARRGAEREIAIGGLEDDAFGREPVEMRHRCRAAIGGQHLRFELVGLDQQDVRQVAGHVGLRRGDSGPFTGRRMPAFAAGSVKAAQGEPEIG